jgi:hypothetical protein
VNKPLPQSPTQSKTSSVYSGSSGYTKIIESYDRTDHEVPPIADIFQPTAYRDTVAQLLNNHNEVPWYADVPKIEDEELRASQSIPTLQYAPFRDERWNASAHEFSQAPTFSDFHNRQPDPVSSISSSTWQHRTSQGFLSPPIVSPPLAHSDYHPSYNHERHYLPGPMSASVTKIVDPHLVPQPLRMSKTASMFFDNMKPHQAPSECSSVKHVELLDIKEAQRRAAAAKQTDLEARAAELIDRRNHQRGSNLIDIEEAQHRAMLNSLRSSGPYEEQSCPRPKSDSSDRSDSFVIYTGLRESVKAMIKQKLKQKKESREIEKAAKVQERERKRVLSHVEERYPAMKSSPRTSTEQRKYSWTAGNSSSGQRSSLTDNISNLFRNLSISKAQHAEEEARGRGIERGRQPKQLAVPPSPYQKYGAEVWYAKNKKKKAKAKGSGGLQRAPTTKKPTANSRFVSRGDIKDLKKTNEDLKQLYSQGRKELINALHVGGGSAEKQKEKGRRFGRTISEKRRERLKQSIAVIGPARQPVATMVDDQWL